MINYQETQPTRISEPNVEIIFPAFNEGLLVQGALEECHHELPKAQFWLIDKNSTDCTKRLEEENFNRLGLRGGILSQPRQGKGFAMRTVFLEVEADIYVMVDTDQTYAARDVHALLKPLVEEGVDICVGGRHSSGN